MNAPSSQATTTDGDVFVPEKAAAYPSVRRSSSSSCRFVVTGFGPFRGVSDNPTSVLSRRLGEVVGGATAVPAGRPGPRRVFLLESRVMETSASAARADVGGIYGRLESSSRVEDDGDVDDGNITTVVLHLGVDRNATAFKLERCAYNDATFRVPDEGGYMPNNECISLLRRDDDRDDDGKSKPLAHDWGRCIETTLDLDDLCGRLRGEQDEAVMVSADPGRFVCNYTYYLSLNRCRTMNDDLRGTMLHDAGGSRDATPRWHALFVHVPPFDVIPEQRQLDFILRVMEAIEWQVMPIDDKR
ncbi:hypothetical protein ACHAXA_002679 [Cyclostephanos tholiformis]|uniref:Uncharacterized protein n=1 Tax=Cyclostephanos tholiformis TaxID=382380 RepID=A0ABD3S030_9STRA